MYIKFAVGPKRPIINGLELRTPREIEERDTPSYYIPSSKSFNPYIDCINKLFEMNGIPLMFPVESRKKRTLEKLVKEHLESLGSKFDAPASYSIWHSNNSIRRTVTHSHKAPKCEYMIAIVPIEESFGGGLHPILVKRRTSAFDVLFRMVRD